MPWSLFPTQRPKISSTSLDLIVLFGLLTLFYSQPLLNHQKVSYGSDALGLFLPAMEHYRISMFHGIIPLWNSNTWMGAPFLATMQSAVLYPPQLISLFFDSSISALSFQTFLSLLWLAYGCYIFGVRALGLERFPSMLMAIAMSCGGMVGGHMDHSNQLAAISWIPWILCEAMLLLLNPRFKYVFFLATCICFQVLSGHPQYVVYTMVYLLALTSCYMVYLYHRRNTSDSRMWSGPVMLVLAIVVGLGLSSVQLLPSMELSSYSIRNLDKLQPDRMFGGSFPPRHLITLISPNAYGNLLTGLHDLSGTPLTENNIFSFNEMVCYVGIITVGMALLAIATMFQEFVVRCFLLLGLCTLMLAFGDHVPNGLAYRIAYAWIPGIEHLRVPARNIIFFNLSLVVLAAMGFNKILFYLRERQRLTHSTLRPLRFLILVLVFADLYMFSQKQIFRHNESIDVLSNKGPAWEVLNGNPGEYRVFRQMREVQYHENYTALLAPGMQEERRRIANRQFLRMQPNLNIISNQQTIRGYEEGLLPTMSTVNFMGANGIFGIHRKNLFTAEPDTILLGLMNVRYILADKPQNSARLKPVLKVHVVDDTSENIQLYINSPMNAWSGIEDDRLVLYENLDYLPRFVSGNMMQKAFNLNSLDYNTRYTDTVYAETDIEKPNLQYRVQNFDYNSFIAEIQQSTYSTQRPPGSPNSYLIENPNRLGSELIMLEAPFPGWVCIDKGIRIPMDRINSLMMGCSLLPDTQNIKISYEPFSFRLGLFFSCLSVAFLFSFVTFWTYPGKNISLKGNKHV